MIDLDSLIEKANDLTPLPVSVSRLASLVAREDCDLREIIEVVSLDQALTIKLLRSSNSAASATRIPITTVNSAVTRLGTAIILSIATGAAVRKRMDQSIPEYGLSEGEFWSHSVAAALAAEVLSAYSTLKVPPESFTAALLHDVGKLVISRFLTPEILGLLKVATEQAEVDKLQAETEILTVHHGELGGLIAQHWKLPESIVKGITHHHTPEEWDSPISSVVYMANVVAKMVEREIEIEESDLKDHSSQMDYLGITTEDLRSVCAAVSEGLEDVSKRYDS